MRTLISAHTVFPFCPPPYPTLFLILFLRAPLDIKLLAFSSVSAAFHIFNVRVFCAFLALLSWFWMTSPNSFKPVVTDQLVFQSASAARNICSWVLRVQRPGQQSEWVPETVACVCGLLERDAQWWDEVVFPNTMSGGCQRDWWTLEG